MQPRLPSSRKWTPIPPELQKQMISVFTNGFKSQLGNAAVELEGRIYPSELVLGLGFRRPSQLKQPNFDVSVTYDVKRDNVMTLLQTMFDALGALFDQYFELADDQVFPLVWEELQFEGRKLHIQYSTRNSDLESKANALLGETSDGLVNEDSEESESELKDVKKKLGLEDDEED